MVHGFLLSRAHGGWTRGRDFSQADPGSWTCTGSLSLGYLLRKAERGAGRSLLGVAAPQHVPLLGHPERSPQTRGRSAWEVTARRSASVRAHRRIRGRAWRHGVRCGAERALGTQPRARGLFPGPGVDQSGPRASCSGGQGAPSVGSRGQPVKVFEQVRGAVSGRWWLRVAWVPRRLET